MTAAITRRSLLLSGLVLLGSGLAAGAKANALYGGEDQEYFNPDLLPPAESEIDYPIEPVNPRRIRKKFRRTVVEFNGNAQPGTIFVDPDNRYLYHVIAPGQATRYGVGVGRQGFEWSGDAIVGIKRRWPRWVPPRTMVDRDANALRWVNGQPGGPDNPLGARALYLYANGVDTLYRIHGTNDPSSIGKAMSSGCIRMLNEDVAHLFDLVEIGTPVIVLPSRGV